MSYALIDNASLTAAQRLLGRIKTRGNDSVDGDIAAFEQLVLAILFYNEVVCIDDYKPEFRLSRSKDFSFIRFINPQDFHLDRIEATADTEAQKFRPEIRGGEFADEDFRQFFHQLRMNIICTWDISSSVYFLTMKMLGQPNTEEFHKYSTISASIFTELNDRASRGGGWDDDVLLFDSAGHPIKDGYIVPNAKWADGKTGGLTPGLRAFVTALHWLTGRTIYYSLVARHLCADTFLHPIRSSFQIHYMRKTGVFGYDFTNALLQSFGAKAKETLSAVISGDRGIALKMDLPLFSAWMVQQAGNVQKVLETALALRNNEEFADARYQILQIREAVEKDDIKFANAKVTKISAGLDKTLQIIRKKYGLSSKSDGVSVSPVIKTFNTFAELKSLPKMPDVEARIPIPEFIQNAFAQQGIVQVYKNILNDLPTIWKLGDTHKKLTEAVQISDEATYSPKTEAPEYRRASSSWKSPM